MSQQEPYIKYKSYDDNAKRIVKRILSLPIHEKLNDDSVQYVIEKVVEFLK